MRSTRDFVELVEPKLVDYNLLNTSDKKATPTSEIAAISIEPEVRDRQDAESELSDDKEYNNRKITQFGCSLSSGILAVLGVTFYSLARDRGLYCDTYFDSLGDTAQNQNCIIGNSSSYSKDFICETVDDYGSEIFSCFSEAAYDFLSINGTALADQQAEAMMESRELPFVRDLLCAGLIGMGVGYFLPVAAPLAKRGWDFCRDKISSCCSTMFGSRQPSADLSSSLLASSNVESSSVPSKSAAL